MKHNAFAVLIGTIAIAWAAAVAAQHEQAGTAMTNKALEIPESIRREHEAIHSALAEAYAVACLATYRHSRIRAAPATSALLPPKTLPATISEPPLTAATHSTYLTNRLINHSVQQTMATDQLSVTFAALADPTRRAILGRLASGECSVTELAEPFEMSLPAVSKHLRVLERAGLIARGRDAQWRPCRLEAARLKEVAEWTERFRVIWEQRFDRLERYLQELKAKEKRHGRQQRRKQ